MRICCIGMNCSRLLMKAQLFGLRRIVCWPSSQNVISAAFMKSRTCLMIIGTRSYFWYILVCRFCFCAYRISMLLQWRLRLWFAPIIRLFVRFKSGNLRRSFVDGRGFILCGQVCYLSWFPVQSRAEFLPIRLLEYQHQSTPE